jgi:hypothetical protein
MSYYLTTIFELHRLYFSVIRMLLMTLKERGRKSSLRFLLLHFILCFDLSVTWARYFFSCAVFIQVLGPTKPPVQCVPRALSLAVKRPGAYKRPFPSSVEVKNELNCLSAFPHAFMACSERVLLYVGVFLPWGYYAVTGLLTLTLTSIPQYEVEASLTLTSFQILCMGRSRMCCVVSHNFEGVTLLL